ncbi:MAG TPA: hypothetical protein VHK67_01200 [Rhabdochlamydiaceae bacterium]|jgi:S-adenosylmethionine/arginine decarboxylase-like enzyme|nr:hypothetical protein [Rhabdochlamydiaceae bacterium]
MKTVFCGFFILFFFCFAPLSAVDEVYEFRGRHLVADYLECDIEALSNEQALMRVMLDAVKKCGAQVSQPK